MARFTITVSEEMYDHLKERAKANLRSTNGEIIFLLEAALAVQNDESLRILRAIYLTTGAGDLDPPILQS